MDDKERKELIDDISHKIDDRIKDAMNILNKRIDDAVHRMKEQNTILVKSEIERSQDNYDERFDELNYHRKQMQNEINMMGEVLDIVKSDIKRSQDNYDERFDELNYHRKQMQNEINMIEEVLGMVREKGELKWPQWMIDFVLDNPKQNPDLE